MENSYDFEFSIRTTRRKNQANDEISVWFVKREICAKKQTKKPANARIFFTQTKKQLYVE